MDIITCEILFSVFIMCIIKVKLIKIKLIKLTFIQVKTTLIKVYGRFVQLPICAFVFCPDNG